MFLSQNFENKNVHDINSNDKKHGSKRLWVARPTRLRMSRNISVFVYIFENPSRSV